MLAAPCGLYGQAGPAEAGHYVLSKPDADAAPACLDPPPTDDALVRRAAEWMLPDRTIEIPEFETGSADIVHGTRAPRTSRSRPP
jgi:hypothetical protein